MNDTDNKGIDLIRIDYLSDDEITLLKELFKYNNLNYFNTSSQMYFDNSGKATSTEIRDCDDWTKHSLKSYLATNPTIFKEVNHDGVKDDTLDTYIGYVNGKLFKETVNSGIFINDNSTDKYYRLVDKINTPEIYNVYGNTTDISILSKILLHSEYTDALSVHLITNETPNLNEYTLLTYVSVEEFLFKVNKIPQTSINELKIGDKYYNITRNNDGTISYNLRTVISKFYHSSLHKQAVRYGTTESNWDVDDYHMAMKIFRVSKADNLIYAKHRRAGSKPPDVIPNIAINTVEIERSPWFLLKFYGDTQYSNKTIINKETAEQENLPLKPIKNTIKLIKVKRL